MNQNVYLIPKEDYTFAVCFAPKAPEDEAILLSEEKEYPVVYCYQEPFEDCKMVICHNREELTIALSNSSKYYHTIHKLWDYDWRTYKSCLFDAWNASRGEYYYLHGEDIVLATSCQMLKESPDLLVYWADIHCPDIHLTWEEACDILESYNHPILLGVDGNIYVKDCYGLLKFDLQDLLQHAIWATDNEIDCVGDTIRYHIARKDVIEGVWKRLRPDIYSPYPNSEDEEPIPF